MLSAGSIADKLLAIASVTQLDGPSDQFKFGSSGNGAQAYPVIDRVRLVDFKHSRAVSVHDVHVIDSTGFHVRAKNGFDEPLL